MPQYLGKPVSVIQDAVEQAKQAAIAADPGPGNDGGSCNLDHVQIKLPYLKKRVALDIGLRPSYKSSWFDVSIPSHGQANRNTVMMEAAADKLQELGYFATVVYIMD